MKKSLCILSFCFAALACCCACKQHNNPENTDDPKTEIAKALQAAALPVYLEKREDVVVRAKGDTMALLKEPAGVAVFLRAAGLKSKGGEQEDMHQAFIAIIAFNIVQEAVPTALYLGGENGEEPEKVENIEMVTPTIGVGMILGATFAAMGAKPLLLVEENVDGAPDNNYLVDLATIQPDRMASIDVRWAKEVENNLEHFAEKTFMRMLCIERSVQLRSIDKVYQMEGDGPEDDKFSIEPLWGGRIW